MAAQILPLLSRYIPASLASRGLKKLSPGIGRFIDSAGLAGYGVDAAIDFLRDQYGQEQSVQAIERDKTARPDEQAMASQIREQQVPGNLLKGAGKIAGDIAASGLAAPYIERGMDRLSGSGDQGQAGAPEEPQGPQPTIGQGPSGAQMEEAQTEDPIAIFNSYLKSYPDVMQPLLQGAQSGQNINSLLQSISSQGRLPRSILRSLQEKLPLPLAQFIQGFVQRGYAGGAPNQQQQNADAQLQQQIGNLMQMMERFNQ